MSQFGNLFAGRLEELNSGLIQGVARPPFYPQWGGATKSFLDVNLFQVARADADWEQLHPIVYTPRDFAPQVAVPPVQVGVGIPEPGDQGPPGPQGPCPFITATPPEFVTVTPTGECSYNFAFVPGSGGECPGLDVTSPATCNSVPFGNPCAVTVDVTEDPDPEICAYQLDFTFDIPAGEPGPVGGEGDPGPPGDASVICRIVSKTPNGTGAGGDRVIIYNCQPVIFNPGTVSWDDTAEPAFMVVRNRDEFRRKNAQHFGIMLEQLADPTRDVIVEVLKTQGTTMADTYTFRYELPTTFPVHLTQLGGSQGDAISPCTYTYNVFDIEGNLILSNVSPINASTQRPLFGAMLVAEEGIGAWDETTMTLFLLRAFETPAVELCPSE